MLDLSSNATLIVLCLSTTVLIVFFRYQTGRPTQIEDQSIAIVVLGDIARSPRMIRHALSFADHDWCVSIFAYTGSKPPPSLTQHPRIKLVNLPEFPDRISASVPKALFATLIGPLKALFLSASLIWTLIVKADRSSYIMVQNPPAIPTLPIVQLARFILKSKLIIDWHNTAYSILALKFGSRRHPIVRLAKWIEAKFGKHATLHLFVTEAEKLYLSRSWALQGRTKVFYDRPPESFCRLSVSEIHSFISASAINQDAELKQMFDAPTSNSLNETLLTVEDPETKVARWRAGRPALLVSSTSWTMDEDFSMLIDSLTNYSKCKKRSSLLPKVICLITGKGPLKEHYEAIIRQRSLAEDWLDIGICCRAIWFEDPDDYRKLLGSADLGISLHQSSSGLDLPMKVVDMFGCGLPVCARNFDSLSELVKHGQNGLVFDSAEELSQQLEELLIGLSPANQSDQPMTTMPISIDSLRNGIKTAKYGGHEGLKVEQVKAWSTWEVEWESQVLETIKPV